jgi:hypothetical protein
LNLILENCARVRYFTNMAETLSAMGVRAEEYDWYISDVETNVGVPSLSEQGKWVSGRELSQILGSADLQFIWAVFSAVPKGRRPPVVIEPRADGNVSYWGAQEVRPQLPGALFEIACWDSSATIFVGLTAEQAASYRRVYPEAKLLASCTVGG